MVAVDGCRDSIISCKGLELCLELLNEHPSSYTSAAEISACERVQQKAAIALSRLCRNTDIARSVVHLQGNFHLNLLAYNR